MRSDHKALAFLGAVAVFGAGVRVVRTAGSSADVEQPALERQAQSADSAARAAREKQSSSRPRKPRAPAKRPKKEPTQPTFGSGAFDRPGYVAGKLDLDVATVAQIDSLPGVGLVMAKRIVLDRMVRGPFVTRDGLRRVSGVGPAFLRKIDTLITFSGTVVQPSPADTALARNRQVRARRVTPPVARACGVVPTCSHIEVRARRVTPPVAPRITGQRPARSPP